MNDPFNGLARWRRRVTGIGAFVVVAFTASTGVFNASAGVLSLLHGAQGGFARALLAIDLGVGLLFISAFMLFVGIRLCFERAAWLDATIRRMLVHVSLYLFLGVILFLALVVATLTMR